MGSVFEDIKWLKDHPHFEFRPASIDEFLGPDYLDITSKVRPGVKNVLYEMFGHEAQENRISIVERAIMTGGIGIGKNFRPSELILTPSGYRPIGSMNRGDSVIGKDGKWHKVKAVVWNEKIQYYRMTFCDGTTIDCGEDHLWQVLKDGNTGRKPVVLNTKQILDKGLRWNGDRKWRFFMPNVEPVDFEEESITIPPYSWAVIFLYGVHLGDRLHFLIDDEKILSRVIEELEGWCLPYKFDGKFCLKRRDDGFGNALWDELENLHDDENKREPDVRYLWGKAEDRLNFLRGLMDAKHAKGQLYDLDYYFQTNRVELLAAIMHLVRSLGGYSRIVNRHSRSGTFISEHKSAHVVLPRGPFWAFDSLNYDPSQSVGTARMDSRRIVAIDKIDIDDGVCISVDSSDSLYVASNFLVTHNTTLASIALPYMAHWVLCLRDPQGYYELLPGSRIAFMQMSTSEQQAREVIFGDIDARIKNSKWFNTHYPRDSRYTKQIRFPKDIWIIPGDSAETTFEGYNILGGILDEADSHKLVKDKDYAQIGMDTIENRIKSRYVDHSDPDREGHKGLLIVIGQMKSQFGFAARTYRQFVEDPRSVAVRMAIWESFGWDRYTINGERNSFWYDVKRKRMIDASIASKIGEADDHLIEVPKQYLYEFTTNPEKALKDLAGIPSGATDPFISQVAKIDDAHDRWKMHHNDDVNPVQQTTITPEIEPGFTVISPSIRRAIHMDLAYSSSGDSAAIAVGHIKELIESAEGDLVPYIVIDLIIRVRAVPGQQIMLSSMRSYIYELVGKYNLRIHKVTLDGFQSVDTMQQFRKRKISVDYLSVDKSKEPYEALRDALNEDRVEFPPYETWLNYQAEVNGDDKVDILRRELTALQDVGNKIDHPPGGSKDVADAVAGVISSLMRDSTYRKGVVSRGDNLNKFDSGSSVLDELFKDFGRATAAAEPVFGGVGSLDVPNLSGLTTSDKLPKRFRP